MYAAEGTLQFPNCGIMNNFHSFINHDLHHGNYPPMNYKRGIIENNNWKSRLTQK